jgi:hypothetical protein
MKHGFRAKRTEDRVTRRDFYQQWHASRQMETHFIDIRPVANKVLVSAKLMEQLRAHKVDRDTMPDAFLHLALTGIPIAVSEHLPIRHPKPDRRSRRRQWMARKRAAEDEARERAEHERRMKAVSVLSPMAQVLVAVGAMRGFA